MSSLYEDKIKNMGNAGRNGGEYYTPRPLIKTIVKVVNPKIGEYSRYNEILSYLKSIDKPFMRWITLDDSLFEFPNKCENLIECNPNTGLEISEVKKLKEWLSS